MRNSNVNQGGAESDTYFRKIIGVLCTRGGNVSRVGHLGQKISDEN